MNALHHLIIPRTVGGVVVRLAIAGAILWALAILDAISIGMQVFK